jgi:hypothetical protein
MTRRKSSEPACRCCGCTEHNACEEGCAWVKVEKGSPPLCSACSGTTADLSETLKRADALLGKFSFTVDPRHTVGVLRSMARAAMRRSSARMKAESARPDKSWGGR